MNADDMPDFVDDVVDPAILPDDPEYVADYVFWRARIEQHHADPMAEMLDLHESLIWDMHFAGALSLEAAQDKIADARALALAAEDLARE
ncbi:hypothetical protein ACWGKS_26405 [Nocardiopsis sp. NPDC055879]